LAPCPSKTIYLEDGGVYRMPIYLDFFKKINK